MSQHPEADARLATVLKANAAFSIVSAVVLFAFSGTLAGLFLHDPAATVAGLSAASVLQILAVLLLPFAGFAAWAANDPSNRRWAVWTIVALDIDWVIATALLLVFAGSAFTTAGWVALIAIAAAVDVFATLQFLGLRRTRTALPGSAQPAAA